MVRRLFLSALLIGFFWNLTCSQFALSQQNDTQPKTSKDGVATLREQLENGLRATTRADKLYTNQVVQLVESGRLSRGVVNYVYKLSIKRRPESPLPYFQRVLRALAKVNI